MKNSLLIFLIMLCWSPAFAQKSEQEILDQFFTLYEDNPQDALDYIYNTTPWIDSQGESVMSLKVKLENVIKQVGNYNGFELITKGALGESFKTYIFMAKYDRQPLRFTIKLYRPRDSWMLFSFSYDLNLDDDLEELLKSKYLEGGTDE